MLQVQVLGLKTARKTAEIRGTILSCCLSFVCLDSLPAITNILSDHLCYAKTIKLYNQNHLTLLSVRLLTLYSALYLPLPLLLLWLVLTLLYTKEGFFCVILGIQILLFHCPLVCKLYLFARPIDQLLQQQMSRLEAQKLTPVPHCTVLRFQQFQYS